MQNSRINLKMTNRKNIPEKIKRSVLLEAGHRCAIPTWGFLPETPI
jgi:hypothetical protein